MISQRAKDENTMDASWKLYDAERMANESLRQQLAVMQKAPRWATHTMVCKQLAEAKAEIESLKSKFDLLKTDPRCDISCMLSCKIEADYYNKLIAEKDAEIELLRQQLTDQKAYYEQVMADGGKRIKDLMDQNEYLRKANKECVEYFNEAQKELAARHLREQQLLEALENYVSNSWEHDCGGGDVVIATCESRELAIKALALPQDTSALEAMIAKAKSEQSDFDNQQFMEERKRLITAAGEAMRKKAVHEANHFLRTDGLYIANAIRALPNVTLEELNK